MHSIRLCLNNPSRLLDRREQRHRSYTLVQNATLHMYIVWTLLIFNSRFQMLQYMLEHINLHFYESVKIDLHQNMRCIYARFIRSYHFNSKCTLVFRIEVLLFNFRKKLSNIWDYITIKTSTRFLIFMIFSLTTLLFKPTLVFRTVGSRVCH